MPIVSVNSSELYYEESGEGYPLLLLHGLGSSGADWWFQTPAFAPHFRVILPNLRGHRQSSTLRGPISIYTLTADVAKLMETMEIPQAHMLGLSLGGAVAQLMAIHFPAKVNKLILVNTFARLRPTSLRETYTLARRVVVSRFLPPITTAKVVARDLFPKPDQAALRDEVLSRIGVNDVASYRYLVDAIRRFDSRAQLHRIMASTLLITGDRDVVVPRGCQQQLVRGIRQVLWHIVRDSGHATPVDQPEEFNRVVLEFLKDEGGRMKDEPHPPPSPFIPHPSSL
jgi:pimeloyl-ACP methyl ester carboxylesterase